MTRKWTLELPDIKAFQLTCRKCGSVLSIPVAQCDVIPDACSRCQTHWFAGGAAENSDIASLASALRELRASHEKQKFYFGLEIDAEEEIERKSK